MTKRVILVSLFLLILTAIESFGEGQIEDKALRDLKIAIISSLNDNEMLIEGQLLTIAENKTKTEKILGCQGKYKANDRNIILGSNESATFAIDGVAKKMNKNVAVFNGCVKIITRTGKSSRNIVINDVQVRLTNGEIITLARMDPVVEKEVNGEIKKYASKWEVRISATWK